MLQIFLLLTGDYSYFLGFLSVWMWTYKEALENLLFSMCTKWEYCTVCSQKYMLT